MSKWIRNSKQVKQSIDFYGIGNDKIHPTDIDAVLEFNNEALILFEVKKINNDLPTGQRLVLERLVNSWHTEKSIALIVKHNFRNDDKDIPLAECWVCGYYFNKKWYSCNEPLKKQLNKILKKWNISKMQL